MIEVICGPMFSGKTEELIRRIKRVIISETSFIVFKPNIDSRNEKENNAIATHDLCGELQAVVVDNIDDIYNKSKDYEVIAIDEAQKYGKGIVQYGSQQNTTFYSGSYPGNGGVAYFPQTANNCIVSLNGVIQSPTSAYTIGTFSAPAVLTGTVGDLLSGEVSISILSDWS